MLTSLIAFTLLCRRRELRARQLLVLLALAG
jgi:hypothetical protein